MTLGARLRRLRLERGIMPGEAGYVIRASDAKMSRLERGRTGFKERDISDLLTLYGVDDPAERETYLDLARQANQPAWWHLDGDQLPVWVETYIALEQAAHTIRTYNAQFVPGLLQTPAYARAMAGEDPHDFGAERRVELLRCREQILTAPEPVTMWAVLDEAVLRRHVGGADVLREQIRHLIELTELPNVIVQVLPYSAAEHLIADGSFGLMRFQEPELDDVVFIDQLTGTTYSDRLQDLRQYRSLLDQLGLLAEPPAVTRTQLAALAAEL